LPSLPCCPSDERAPERVSDLVEFPGNPYQKVSDVRRFERHNSAMRILLIEDDKAAAYLTKGLTESGHVVDRAADG
jgi:cystathionine beta-lyase/cystathionine gamma-synthase